MVYLQYLIALNLGNSDAMVLDNIVKYAKPELKTTLLAKRIDQARDKIAEARRLLVVHRTRSRRRQRETPATRRRRERTRSTRPQRQQP